MEKKSIFISETSKSCAVFPQQKPWYLIRESAPENQAKSGENLGMCPVVNSGYYDCKENDACISSNFFFRILFMILQCFIETILGKSPIRALSKTRISDRGSD